MRIHHGAKMSSSTRRKVHLPCNAGSAAAAVLVVGMLLSACGSSGTVDAAGGSAGEPNTVAAAGATSPAGGSMEATASSNTALNSDAGTAMPNDMLPQQFRDRGYLNIPMTFGAPPNAFKDEDGNPTGALTELTAALAKPLGVELKVIDAPWDSVLAGIQSERFDAQIGQVRITDERRKQMNFVEVLKSQLDMVIAVENEPDFVSWTDFCGRVVGQLAGSLQIETVKEQSKLHCEDKGLPAIEITTFKDAVDMHQAVLVGRIDGSVNSAAVIAYQIQQSNGQLARAADIHVSDGSLGIAVGAKNLALAKAIAAALQDLIDDGTYTDILGTWGMQDLALADAKLLPVTG